MKSYLNTANYKNKTKKGKTTKKINTVITFCLEDNSPNYTVAEILLMRLVDRVWGGEEWGNCNRLLKTGVLRSQRGFEWNGEV